MTTTTKRLAIRRPGNRGRRARVVQAATDIFSMNEPVSADGKRVWDNALRKVQRDRCDPRFNRARKVRL